MSHPKIKLSAFLIEDIKGEEAIKEYIMKRIMNAITIEKEAPQGKVWRQVYFDPNKV